MSKTQITILSLIAGFIILVILFGRPAEASIIYSDRDAFSGSANHFTLDDYQNTGYQSGDIAHTEVMDRWSDEGMSGVIGTTNYQTTRFEDSSAVALYMLFHHDGTPATDRFYCGACNGSFLTTWDSAVASVGLDIASNYSSNPYYAWVTYGDGSTEDFALPLEENARITTTFWGVSSLLGITSIHWGDPGGAVAHGGSFAIDNLTLGERQIVARTAAVAQVPEPWTIWLFGIGFIGLMLRLKQ